MEGNKWTSTCLDLQAVGNKIQYERISFYKYYDFPLLQIWGPVLPPCGGPLHLVGSHCWHRPGNLLPQVNQIGIEHHMRRCYSFTGQADCFYAQTTSFQKSYWIMNFSRLAILNNVPAGGGRRRREVEEEDRLLNNQHIFDLLDHNLPQPGDDVGYGEWASKDEKLLQDFFPNDPAANSSAWLLGTLRDLAQQLAKWKKEEDSLETSLSSAWTNRTNIDNDEESCLVSTWRCMSTVLEGGISCFQSPGKFQR